MTMYTCTCTYIEIYQGLIYPGSHRTLRAKKASLAIQFHQCIAINCDRKRPVN